MDMDMGMGMGMDMGAWTWTWTGGIPAQRTLDGAVTVLEAWLTHPPLAPERREKGRKREANGERHEEARRIAAAASLLQHGATHSKHSKQNTVRQYNIYNTY